jgi:hypothetical protein
MSKENNNLDHLVQVLKDCNFENFSILGFSFYFAQRLSFVLPDDKTDNEIDSQEFITSRFNSYLNVDRCEEFNTRYSQELYEQTFSDISNCFKSLAYYLQIELNKDRLNINGEKADHFNPEKYMTLSLKEPNEILEVYDWNELYSMFFYELGRAIEQSTFNYHEAYALSDRFTTFYSEKDQIGFCQIIQQSFKMPPPFFTNLIDPNRHFYFFDDSGPRKDKLLPFQIALGTIVPNNTVGEFVWNQTRLLFFHPDSNEPINTHLQFQDIASSEPLLEGYYEKIFLPNISFFRSKKEEIVKALEGVNSSDFLKLNTNIIVSSKVKIQSKFDLIYKVLKESWGFDANIKGSFISSNLTFFAYFYYCFVLCCIINLEESED